MSESKIDNHPQKIVIIDRILSGLSARAVCHSIVPPISPASVYRFKASNLMPLLRHLPDDTLLVRADNTISPANTTVELTSEMQILEEQSLPPAPVAAAAATPAPAAGSVFRSRLENLYHRAERALNRAETAVRVATDREGNEVVVGADLNVMAPLLNQAHKNLEMLGRATGELEPVASATFSVQILTPWAGSSPDQMPRVSYSDAPALEAAAEVVPDTANGVATINVIP